MAGKSYKIPTVLSAEELKDKAFRRASKITVMGTNALDGKKKTILAKVTAVGDIIKDTLDGYVNTFPRLEKEEDFFPELVDIVIGLDRYKKSLGAINWASDRVKRLKTEALRNIRRTKDMAIMESVRGGFYGRVSSVLEQVSKDLEFLGGTRDQFRKLPAISPDVPTVVIAGFPNVGKSRLVAELSTAEPEIAPYPFTTKGVIIGHLKERWKTYQIIDTPGLLDRPLDERNSIEKQAIVALKYLSDVLLFVLDPSETCGYSMEKQNALLESVKEGFANVPIIVAESKSDIKKTGSGNIFFSSETRENIDALLGMITAELGKVPYGGEDS